MFKSEAKLFLSANNNLNYAKTLINECKRIVTEMELQGNSDYTNCKNSIANCDIDGLTNKVETTKESLMKLDQNFASEYMTLLQEYLQTSTIDTSNMTDEERMQYNIQMNGYARDYNQNLLYMLEKYEESGMLTPELQAQLEMQRTIVEQYDVQDEMAALPTTSQEYIDLFKKNAEYDKQLINLNPNLTEAEKASYLEEYETNFGTTLEILELNRDVATKTDELKELEAGSEAYYKKENEIRQLQINYYENKGQLTEEEQKQLEFLKDGIELNELYIDKEQNDGFWHPFVEGEYDEAILDKKIEMGIATEDEIEYKNMNGWERAWENTKTFTTSLVFGIGSVTETIVDGGVMLAGGIGSIFGADTQWAEDFVSINFADEAYSGMVESGCINSVAAYSGWHTAGNMIGTTAGYVALSFLPGGKVTMAITGGLSAMGSSSQRALDSGATFNEAFGTGAVSGVVGAAAGWAVGKLGTMASGTTSLLQVGGYTAAGMGVSTIEPIVNSVTEYIVYADEMVDENGEKVYDNIWDYYVDGGGLTNTVMAGVAGGISTGAASFKGYKSYKNLVESDLALGPSQTQKATTKPNDEFLQSINSDKHYKFDNQKEFEIARELQNSGRTDAQIANTFAAKATRCADIKTKNNIYEFTYKYLLESTGSAEYAEQLVVEAFNNQLNARGMATVLTDNGVNYNVINGFNSSNQAYDIKYIQKQLDQLPPQVRSSIKNVNIYDSRNPFDKHWAVKYNDPNFVSAATAGGDTINLWANSSTHNSILPHEAGHCFDSQFFDSDRYYIGKYSQSPEYQLAMQKDFELTKKSSITSYGANNAGEDFADTLSAYINGKVPDNGRWVSIDDFPNRKAFLDKIFKENIHLNTTNIDVTSKV